MKKLVLALVLALLPSLVMAQQFPVIPDHTVIGRIGTGSSSGASQAIPFLNFNSLLGNHVLPGTYAADPQFGMKCNGVDDDSAALQLAVNTADANMAWPVYVPSGTCPIANTVYLNKSAGSGVLTVPGLKIQGQGLGVTILDTRVANGYALAVNPAWMAGHKSLALITAQTTGGSLATNTYFVKVTMNDGLGNEVVLGPAKSIAVTGSTGRINIPLQPLPSPAYSYNLYCGTTSTPTNYCLVSGGNASGLGGNQTVAITAFGSAHTPSTSPNAIWQNAQFSDFSITNSTGATNASGILCFKCGYADITRAYMFGLSGDGVDVPNYTGDSDGTFNLGIHNSKFDTIAGISVNAIGAFLELSNFTVDSHTAFNACGTPVSTIGTPVTISTIPNGSTPIVTTSGSHNLLAGDQIAFNVSGMTLANTWYRVGATVTGNTFNLVDQNGNAVNTTSLGTFTSGTVSLSWRPPQWNATTLSVNGTGCLAWQGLIGTFRDLDFTQGNNFSLYVSENGSSDNMTVENVDFENTAGKALYIGSLLGGSVKNIEILTTQADGATISGIQLGTGFAGGNVSNLRIGAVKYRGDFGPSVGFEQFQNTNIGATYQDTNRVTDVTWQTEPTTRFSGFVFDPIPGQVRFSISAQNTVKVIPAGYGSALPLHLKSPGEWVAYHVPSAGVTGTVTGALSAATVYNCYAHNSAALGFPYALSFACNAHTTALDEGYAVDSTDKTWTFIGTANTDGSGNFQTGSTQTSWYPPAGGNVTVTSAIANGVAVYASQTLIGSTVAGTNGQILAGQTGALPSWVAMSGDATIANTGAITLATVNANTGAFGDATHCVTVTNNAKGLTTAISAVTCAPAAASLTGTLQAAQEPAHTGDVTNTAGSLALAYTNVVPANKGGAGAISGALKGNGSGTVAQAACADLSNGAAGCSEANAAKSDMQTPSSSSLVVTPAQTQNHPGVAKFWARMDGKTGSTCTIGASYNIASCVRNSTGNYTLTFTTAFANTNYAVMLGAATDTGVTVDYLNVAAGGYATGTLTFTCISAGTQAVNDCDSMSISGFGSQ